MPNPELMTCDKWLTEQSTISASFGKVRAEVNLPRLHDLFESVFILEHLLIIQSGFRVFVLLCLARRDNGQLRRPGHVARIYTNRPREYGIRFYKRWGD